MTRTVLAVPIAQSRATMHLDTLATMVDDAYVNHMPVNTGGRGKDALRAFYTDTLGGMGPTFHYPHAHIVDWDAADTDRASSGLCARASMRSEI